jgi:hypothetical protein
MNDIFQLLLLFQFKHYFADFPLQTSYMLGKFKSGEEWILPLFAHSAVHGLFTFVIVYFFRSDLAIHLAATDLIAHSIMDRIKASPALLGRFKALSSREMRIVKRGPSIPSQIVPFEQSLRSNTYFWWSLGFDQMFHHMTHYYIIWRILS